MNRDAFYEDSFANLLSLSPEVATELGIRQVAGRQMPQGGFSDITPSGEERRRSLMMELLARIRAFQEAGRGGEGDLNLRVYEFFLRWGVLGRLRGTESHGFHLCDYVADHLVGVQAEIITCLGQWQPLETEEDSEAFLARVAAVPGQIDDLIQALCLRREAGNLMPWCIIQRVVAEIDALLAAGITGSPIYIRFVECGSQDHCGQLENLLKQGFNPAYLRLREFLLNDYPQEDRVGVWRLRNGEGFYRFLLKAFTTTDLTANEIHSIGLGQLAELQQEVAGKLGAAGYGGKSLVERFAAFDHGQEMRIPPVGTDENRRGTEALAEAIIRDTAGLIRPLFGIWPRSHVVVKPIPAIQEGNRSSGYVPPTSDGSRPGVLDLNLSQCDRLQLYTLVYHEAMPGHHVQLSIAQELGGELPSFRRILVHDGFVEGWAKYAEALPWIEGINDDPLWDISRSRNELFSTANLVIDTGIHHHRWSREQAVSFFVRNTASSSVFAEFIVDRSIARPGQLCAYKLGMMTMLAARDRMQKAFGCDFDIRRFHDLILGQGSIPLALLDEIVNGEITRIRQC